MKSYNITKLYSDIKILSKNMESQSEKQWRRNADPALLKKLQENTLDVKEISVLPTPSVGEISVSTIHSTTGGKVNLKDVTFIIPIKIDSNDRLENFYTTFEYLTQNLDTNIIIYESDSKSQIGDKLNGKATYIFEKNDGAIFHRTRYLNHMLNMVKTPVTVNYDIDVLLPIDSYVAARDRIIKDELELVYPYCYGDCQHRVNHTGRNSVKNGKSLENLENSDFQEKSFLSWYGHCQFFNTDAYKKYGWENEHFISYGPEDLERYHRFIKLDRKVEHLDNRIVYHLEHERGNNSSKENIYFYQNERLYNVLQSFTKTQLIDYYNSVEYISKYITL